MKRINLEEKSSILNKYIQENQGKTLTGAELEEVFCNLGFNRTVAYRIARSAFQFEKIGSTTVYEVPKKPVYIGIIKTAYSEINKAQRKRKQAARTSIKEETSEEVALALLSSKGYQIRKCTGLDVEKLRTKYPEVYKACLKWELV